MSTLIPNGLLKGSDIRLAKSGDHYVRMFQAVIAGSQGKDLRPFHDVAHAGLDCSPPVNSMLVSISAGASLRFAVASNDFIEPTCQRGEIEMYSSDGVHKKARMKCTANSKVYIGSETNEVNLRGALTKLIQGIQGATCGGSGSPLADTTGKIAGALIDLQALLDSLP